ncbi:MAG: DUF2132 domain-containing protein [Candidatus Gracilibacteria bacterium]|nr:DUF2132 domain-containing protein [Candidatus Gracilibacteria bacterium]
MTETNTDSNVNHRLLHGVKLAEILDYLIDQYGFDDLATLIRIKCFSNNPSKQSALKFLRKTDWARQQVQGLYIRTKLENKDK